MTNIQTQITAYIGDKSEPSQRDLLAFVGMVEGGEASWQDFCDVGGLELAVRVAGTLGFVAGSMGFIDSTEATP